MKTQAQFLLVTLLGASTPIAVPAGRLFSVYESEDGTRTFLRYVGTKKHDEIEENLDDVFNQQNTDRNNLNMILVTNSDTGRRMIVFTQHLDRISVNGTGSKIAFLESSYTTLYVDESLANIYAYQGNGGSVNLGMVFVTEKVTGNEFILFSGNIKTVYPYPETGVPTGSTISFLVRGTLNVDETPTNIYNNQPQ